MSKKVRKYNKKRRAQLEEETRRRITEALVELHGSVGPARTTIRAVAEKAGVQRATVYRHFPDEASMFAACSAHWAARNPAPDIATWSAIDDADRRTRVALSDLYAFFERNQRMLANNTRDEPLVEAVGPPMEAFRDYLRAAADTIAEGRREKGKRRRQVRAAIGHAVSFSTWSSLARDQGLASDEAAEVMSRMIAGAGGS